tara:strand:- start:747 stop:1091 length:345 start_codon:yes stop_codon:yes gene_type:complete
MKDNKLIAEFMSGEHPLAEVTHEAHHNYHTSWDWLMPVVSKCFKTGDDTHQWDNIMDTIFTCDINIVYAQVVEFIKDHNKYICGSCGEGCSNYTYNEDTDTDECNDCKTSNNER